MLKEALHVMQVRGEPRRRWFDDEYFDLIVWYEPEDAFFGFQLCYDQQRKARALTWTRQYGYKHTGIDSGESAGGVAKGSPVLVADGLFDAPSVAQLFEAAAAHLPREIKDFVLGKVKGFL